MTRDFSVHSPLLSRLLSLLSVPDESSLVQLGRAQLSSKKGPEDLILTCASIVVSLVISEFLVLFTQKRMLDSRNRSPVKISS